MKVYDHHVGNTNLDCPNQSVDLQGSERTADYSKLLEYGLDSKVADKLDDIYKVKHLYKSQRTSNLKEFVWVVMGWLFCCHQQGRIDFNFNTANPSLSTGKDFLIHSL